MKHRYKLIPGLVFSIILIQTAIATLSIDDAELIDLWYLNDSSGNFIGYKNNYEIIPTGSITYKSPYNLSNITQYSVNLGGTGYLNCSDCRLNEDGWTILLFHYSQSGGEYHCMGNTDASSFGFYWYMRHDQNKNYFYTYGVDNLALQSIEEYDAGQVWCTGLMINSSGASFWRNGTEIDYTDGGYTYADRDLVIGTQSWPAVGGAKWNTQLQYLAVYNKSLTSLEIKEFCTTGINLGEATTENVTILYPYLNDYYTDSTLPYHFYFYGLDATNCSLYTNYTGEYNICNSMSNEPYNETVCWNESSYYYIQNISLSDTVGAFRMENSLIDSSPSGNDGTGIGTYNFTSSQGSNATGNYTFYVNNGYSILGNVYNYSHTDKFSISTWIYPTSSGSIQGIFSKRLNSGTYHGYMLYLTSTNKLSFVIDGNGGASDYSVLETNLSIPINKWSYITATYNGAGSTSGMRLYVNATLQNTSVIKDDYANSMLNTVNAEIGTNNNLSFPFYGYIDEVLIFENILSQTNITYLYDYGIESISIENISEECNTTEITPSFNQSTNYTLECNFPQNTRKTYLTSYINCFNGGNVNSSFLYFSYDNDLSPPAIGVISPLETNATWNVNIEINTSTDEEQLYSVYFNITDETTTKYYSFYEQTNETDYYFSKNIYTLNWSNQTYFGTIRVCDAHTKKEIKDAKLEKNKDSIRYNFDEVSILIYSLTNDLKEIKTKKKFDRYDLELEFKDIKDTIQIVLESSENLMYIQDSHYIGHFVTGNHWIDFENDLTKDITVERYINNSYLITIDTPLDKIRFNSIGELNCNNLYFNFDLVYTDNPYALDILRDTNWFNTNIINLNTTSGVLLLIFIFLILVALIIFSEYLQIPAFMILASLLCFFIGIFIYTLVSAIVGFFIIIFSVFYSFRSFFILK